MIVGWAKHVTVVGQMTTCVMPVDMQHSHVERPFMTTVLLWLLERRLCWGTQEGHF